MRKILKQQRKKQQQMKIVIMEQMVSEDHFLRKADRVVDFSNCVPRYCADNGRPAIATRKGPAKPGGKADGFYCSGHCTMDRERNVILDIGVEPTNINDVTPIVGILNETEERLGAPPG